MKRRKPCIFLFLLVIWFIISCASDQETVQSDNPKPVTTSAPAKAPEPAATPKPAPVVPAPPPPAAPSPQDIPRSSALILEGARSHRVVWGETLSSISKKYYGQKNGYYFPLIMLASGKAVLNPDVIIPGTILTIPDLDKNLADPPARGNIKAYLKDTARLDEQKRDMKTSNNLIQLSDSL
jgi:hypothetical protein